MTELPPNCHQPRRTRPPRFSVSPLRRRGRVEWVVSWFANGKRRRAFFRSQPAARAHAAKLKADLATAGAGWLALSPQEQQRLVWLHHEATLAGVTLEKVWQDWLARPTVAPSVTLEHAIGELLAAKRDAGRAPVYLESLGLQLRQFARGRESMDVANIGMAEIDAWLAGRPAGTRLTLRGRVWTLMRFAIRKGWRVDNPCERMESITVAAKPPAILTVEQTRQCLAALQVYSKQVSAWRGLAWFVLTTLCGLRPTEAALTTWAAVNFEEGWIRVEAQTSKTRRRRVVYPLPIALAWLKLARAHKSTLPLGEMSKRRTIAVLRECLCWKEWPKDVTRHTAASYWLALDGDPAKVAAQLGHSPATLARHYKALVTRAEAEAFWAIKPAG